MSKFDYIKYDKGACDDQELAKKMVQSLEKMIGGIGHAQAFECVRAKALALAKLEEVYMWIGKAIRDYQIARNGSAELQEERGDD